MTSRAYRYCPICATDVEDVGGFCLLGHDLRLKPPSQTLSEFSSALDDVFDQAQRDVVAALGAVGDITVPMPDRPAGIAPEPLSDDPAVPEPPSTHPATDPVADPAPPAGVRETPTAPTAPAAAPTGVRESPTAPTAAPLAADVPPSPDGIDEAPPIEETAPPRSRPAGLVPNALAPKGTPPPAPDELAAARARWESIWAPLAEETSPGKDPIEAFAPVPSMDWGPPDKKPKKRFLKKDDPAPNEL